MITNDLIIIYLIGAFIRLFLVILEIVLFILPHIIRTKRLELHIKIMMAMLALPFLTLFDPIGSWASFLIINKCVGDNYFIERIIKAHVNYFFCNNSCLNLRRDDIMYLHPSLILKELNIFGISLLKEISYDNIFFDTDFLIYNKNNRDKLKLMLELTE